MKIWNFNPKHMNTFYAPGGEDVGGVVVGPGVGGNDSEEPSEPEIYLRTRNENLIARIAESEDAKVISPKTREEYFLSMIAGDTEAGTIVPKTKDEYILAGFISGTKEGGVEANNDGGK